MRVGVFAAVVAFVIRCPAAFDTTPTNRIALAASIPILFLYIILFFLIHLSLSRNPAESFCDVAENSTSGIGCRRLYFKGALLTLQLPCATANILITRERDLT
jgi:hypothetical protein